MPTKSVRQGVKFLRILFVLGFPNPFPGAGWTRIDFFADAWSKKGHSVEVLGTFTYKSFSKKGAKKSHRTNIFNIVFNVNLSNPIIFALNSFISFLISAMFMLARKPDVAVISVPPGDAGLGALTACKMLKVKCIIDYRDEWEDFATTQAKSKIEKNFYQKIKNFNNIIYAGAKLIVAVTPNTMKVLTKRGLNVKVITNGADIKTFKPLNAKKSSRNYTIFYSGGVGSYYRLDIALKAIKKLVDKGLDDIQLVIAGEGEIGNILDLAKKLGLSDYIDYAGSISEKTKLARLIAASDAGLIPYDDNPLWKNSIPAKFYEYCACGIPVIATTHTDSLLAEIIRKYQIGVTSPPLDEEKLADAILWLYQNKSFRESAGKRARKLIEEKFDRNKIAEEYLSLIKEVADPK